ncbi:MAG: heat-inducible transcriptional repressor HrcA [Betaproteobacteria bacterium]
MEVLHEIVRAYIETGEPVASRSISRRRAETLSPASIRNVMADLVDEGYLAQPHTSAGRVPTQKAFQSYVHSLSARSMLNREFDRFRNELSQVDSMEARVERSSQMLTELTQVMGIAATIPAARQTLDQIELVALPDKRVLIIVVTSDRVVRNRLVLLDEWISQDDLNNIRNYINRNFSGWVLADVREELQRRLTEESAAFDQIMRRLDLLYSRGLLDVGFPAEIHTDGASNLVGLDLHLTKERMRELLRALEEKKKVLELLDHFLEQPAGELGVQVGLGDTHPAMQELSLIGLPMILPNGLSAVIAVLGPIRMDYARVMSAVFCVGQAFRNA